MHLRLLGRIMDCNPFLHNRSSNHFRMADSTIRTTFHVTHQEYRTSHQPQRSHCGDRTIDQHGTDRKASAMAEMHNHMCGCAQRFRRTARITHCSDELRQTARRSPGTQSGRRKLRRRTERVACLRRPHRPKPLRRVGSERRSERRYLPRS